MRKILYSLLVLFLLAGVAGCVDISKFRVKGFKEDRDSPIININLEYDVTMTTLNIESEIKNWSLIKKDTREDYWSFSEDISKPNEIIKVDGSYNKSINIYLKKNSSKQLRASHITVCYDGMNSKLIQIIQNYKPY